MNVLLINYHGFNIININEGKTKCLRNSADNFCSKNWSFQITIIVFFSYLLIVIIVEKKKDTVRQTERQKKCDKQRDRESAKRNRYTVKQNSVNFTAKCAGNNVGSFYGKNCSII